MVDNTEGDVTKREFLHNILIGVVLIVLIIPFAFLLSKNMMLDYGSEDAGVVSRIVLVFGTFILIIYSIMVLLVKFIINLSRPDSDNLLSQSAQQVTGNWYKWLIVIFLIFVLMMLFLVLRAK